MGTAVTQAFVPYVVLCRWFLVSLSVLFLSLYWLSFDLRLLITLWLSSNFSCQPVLLASVPHLVQSPIIELWLQVFNDTFNYISVISWRPVLLVKEIENHRPAASHWQTLSPYGSQTHYYRTITATVIMVTIDLS